MDAFKPENIYTDSENISSDLLDPESSVLAEDEHLSLDASASSDELSELQSLEDEFADLTQQTVQNSSEFDMSALEIESDVDLDEEFAAFQTSQVSEKDNDSVSLNPELDEINELLLDEAFEIESKDPDDEAEALINPFESDENPDLNRSDMTRLELEVNLESELSQVEALLGSEPAEADEKESETTLDEKANDNAAALSEPSLMGDLTQLEGLTETNPSPASESFEENRTELSSDQDGDHTEFVLDLELDSEPGLISAPSLKSQNSTNEDESIGSDIEIPQLSIQPEFPSEDHAEPAPATHTNDDEPNALMDAQENDFEAYSTLGIEKEESDSGSNDIEMLDVDTALEEVTQSSQHEESVPEFDITSNTAAILADDSSSGNETDSAQSDERVIELESIVQQNQVQIEELQALVDSKIDPEIHTHLLQELRQYKAQVVELETSIQAQQEDQIDTQTPVSIADHESLQRVADEQKQNIADLQETIARLEADVTDWQSQAESQIKPAEYDALQAQSASQSELISDLETEVQTLKSNYEQSQIESSQKVEPGDYHAVQAEVQQLTAQVQDWAQRHEELSQNLAAQTQLASTRIDPTEHENLTQALQDYRGQVERLEAEKSQLEAAVKTWQEKAESKIDRAEYEAVLEQVQVLKEKNARSLWARIIDWVMGK